MRKRLFQTLLLIVISSVFLVGCDKKAPAPSASPEIQAAIELATHSRDYNKCNEILLGAVEHAKSPQDIICLKKYCSDSLIKDEIILSGVSLCNKTEDYVLLATNCSSFSNKEHILYQGVGSCKSIDDIMLLSRYCSSSSNHDRILLKGTRFAKNNDDYRTLARYCHSTSNRGRILSIAAERSSSINEPNNKVQSAYEAMQNAYKAYQKGIQEQKPKAELKVLIKDYKNKKAAYDKLVK